MTEYHDLAVLENLLRTLVDHIALYGIAAERRCGPKVSEAIAAAKNERAQLLRDLTAKLWQNDRSLVGQVAELGKADIALDRMRALGDADEVRMLNELVAADGRLRAVIASAIEDGQLTPHMQNYLNTVIIRVERQLEHLTVVRASVLF